ncbi:MAG TPA: carbohydrate binding domain-containing protein, partial [Gaiellaceae bacterium]|nr:carbohydrate binding domain-containing protein [Gaiellaceae bacterium]
SGAPDPGWNDSGLQALRNVPGSAFEAVDVSSLKVSNTSYAVADAPPPLPRPPPVELVTNPGFETALTGWVKGHNGTVLARTCAVAHGGSCSAALARPKSAGDGVLDDLPNSVSSATAGVYAASAWVRAPAGRTVTLRVREVAGSSVVRTNVVSATATGAWQQLAVTTVAVAAGRSLSVEVVASLAKGSGANVDDVSLRRA